MQLFQIIIIIFISYYVVLTLMNHCSVCEEDPMVAVDLVQACSAFHNDDPYGEEDDLACSDAYVEEVCDDGDDSNMAVGDIPHCVYGNIHSCPFHIHQTDTG
jgi:hypothetical protein